MNHQIKSILVAGSAFCCVLFAAEDVPTSPPASFQIGQTWTNYVPWVIRTLQVEQITTPCPECGGPNHHERHVDYMGRYGNIYLPVRTARHGTNQNLVGTTSTNYYMATNTVLRVQSRTQPGWTTPVPPLP